MADTDAAGRLVRSAKPPPNAKPLTAAPNSLCCLTLRQRALLETETAVPISLCSAKVSASASASASASVEAGAGAAEAGAAEAGTAGARGEAGTAEEAAGAPSGGSFTLDELFALRTALRSKECCLPRERLPGELDALVEGEVAVARAGARGADVVSGARTAGGWPPTESDEARRRLMA
jgi:hypothetical protein